jgi:hypothetical protein
MSYDADILAQPAVRRVKNYQRSCRQCQYYQDQFLCFYDDDMKCTRTEDNNTHGFSFQTNPDICDKIWYNGRSMCAQDHLTNL